MGIGSKPFMDIKPSDAAISDRAIDYIMKGTGEPAHLYVGSVSHILQGETLSCSPFEHEPYFLSVKPWSPMSLECTMREKVRKREKERERERG